MTHRLLRWLMPVARSRERAAEQPRGLQMLAAPLPVLVAWVQALLVPAVDWPRLAVPFGGVS